MDNNTKNDDNTKAVKYHISILINENNNKTGKSKNETHWVETDKVPG